MAANKTSVSLHQDRFEAIVPFNRTEKCVLRLLREHQRIGRAQLARLLGLTRAAMSKVINSLMDRKVLKTCGITALNGNAGRPIELIEIEGKTICGIGISVGHHIEIVVLDLAGNEIHFDRMINPLRTCNDDDAPLIGKIVKRVRTVWNKAGRNATLLGIGISSGGDADASASEFLRTNMFRDVAQANRLVHRLAAAFEAPVVIEHEARAALLAERNANPDIPAKPSILLIQDSLGFALMLEGRVYQGPLQWMRWLGHIQVNPDGALCDDLLPGALGCTASPTAMTLKFQTGHYQWTREQDQKTDQKGMKAIYQAYNAGDKNAVAIIEQAFTDIGKAIRNIALMFSLDQVILHGWPKGIAADGIKRIQAVLSDVRFGPPENRYAAPAIRQASLGTRQQAIGGALCVFEEALRDHQPEIR